MNIGGIEIPRRLIDELNIWISTPNPLETVYLLYTRLIGEKPNVDGYVRISKSSLYPTSYNVFEVLKFYRNGYIPLMIIQLKFGNGKPDLKDFVTWWITDGSLNMSLIYVIAYPNNNRLGFNTYSLKNCMMCDRRTSILKEVEMVG